MSPAALAAYLDGCRQDPPSSRPLGAGTGKPIKAVVPVHSYGQVADMNAIQQTAERHGLLVIEEYQAHGAEHSADGGRRRRAGSIAAHRVPHRGVRESGDRALTAELP